MIPWDGEEMHEGPTEDAQCVNCDRLAEENGWCAPCWSTIVPPATQDLVDDVLAPRYRQ